MCASETRLTFKVVAQLSGVVEKARVEILYCTHGIKSQYLCFAFSPAAASATAAAISLFSTIVSVVVRDGNVERTQVRH